MKSTLCSGNSWKKPLDCRQKIWKGVDITFCGLVIVGALGLWIYCIALCEEMMREYEAVPVSVRLSE